MSEKAIGVDAVLIGAINALDDETELWVNPRWMLTPDATRESYNGATVGKSDVYKGKHLKRLVAQLALVTDERDKAIEQGERRRRYIRLAGQHATRL